MLLAFLLFASYNCISSDTINYGSAYLFSPSSGLTWSSNAALHPSDPAFGDQFGQTVAISKDFMIVGDYEHKSYAGTAYIFDNYQGHGWTLMAKLSPQGIQAGSYFGYDVALWENTIIITAPRHDSSKGVAYSYTHYSGDWNLDQVIIPTSDVGNYFGTSVSLYETSALIGVTEYGSGSGRVLVYSSDPTLSSLTKWTLEAKLAPQDKLETASCFGVTVSQYGSNAIVGTVNTGYVYIFSRVTSGGTSRYWTQMARLVVAVPSSNRVESTQLSMITSVSLYGTNALVGVSDDASSSESGAAYIFMSFGAGTLATWSQQSRLTPRSWDNVQGFGVSVALSGNLAAVGSLIPGGGGTVYIYEASSTASLAVWTLEALLRSPDDVDSIGFGCSVALYGDALLVGAVASYSPLPEIYSEGVEMFSVVVSVTVGFTATLLVGLLLLYPSYAINLAMSVSYKVKGLVYRSQSHDALPAHSEDRGGDREAAINKTLMDISLRSISTVDLLSRHPQPCVFEPSSPLSFAQPSQQGVSTLASSSIKPEQSSSATPQSVAAVVTPIVRESSLNTESAIGSITRTSSENLPASFVYSSSKDIMSKLKDVKMQGALDRIERTSQVDEISLKKNKSGVVLLT